LYQILERNTVRGERAVSRETARRESGFGARCERFDAMAVKMAPLVAAAHAALRAKVARIDALNVYPVPDGDTGTNMLLTLEFILKEASGNTYEGFGAASRAGARAALMGARGNSGVILSPSGSRSLPSPSPPRSKGRRSGPTPPCASPPREPCSPS
jgi:hypothetical protein